MHKKMYLVPPDLLEAVKREIPRTVSLQDGYRMIVEVGLSKFSSTVLPRFKDEAFLAELSAMRMRLGNQSMSSSLWLFFDSKKTLDVLADRVKGARDAMRKLFLKGKVKGKGFTYHVIIAIFRVWLAGYFAVDFVPAVSRR
jgi:hypothetical protein